MTRQHARRIASGAVVALTLAGLVAGCSSHPGAAAVVDGREIAASDVADAVTELEPAFPGVSALSALQILIDEPTLSDLASGAGLAVSDEDAIAYLTNQLEGQGQPTPEEFSSGTLAIGRYLAAVEKLNASPDIAELGQEYTERVSQLDVTVNPRYGSYDASGGLAAPVTPPWVVGAPAS